MDIFLLDRVMYNGERQSPAVLVPCGGLCYFLFEQQMKDVRVKQNLFLQ